MSGETCSKKGCGKPATLYPVMLLFPPGQPDFPSPIRASLKLPICREDSETIHVSELLTDEAWRFLCELTRRAGRVIPDRDTVLLVFEELPWRP